MNSGFISRVHGLGWVKENKGGCGPSLWATPGLQLNYVRFGRLLSHAGPRALTSAPVWVCVSRGFRCTEPVADTPPSAGPR